MRMFVAWLFMSWKNLLLIIQRKIHWLEKVLFHIVLQIIKRININVLFSLLHLQRFMKLTRRNHRNIAEVALQNQCCLLPEGKMIDFVWTGQRRRLLDYAATWGQNGKVLAQLDDCAALLDAWVKPYHQAGKPVILAPMHFLSDILAGIVASKVHPGKGTVVVSANAGAYEEQDRLRGGVTLSYCSIHRSSEGIASGLARACMDATALKTNMIIFPDIVPEYTYSSGVDRSSKLKCRLFNREAHLHNGISRLAKLLHADVIFYHIYYDAGIKINILPAVSANEVSNKLPAIVEQVIKDHPQDWLLWHLHSLYFINE